MSKPAKSSQNHKKPSPEVIEALDTSFFDGPPNTEPVEAKPDKPDETKTDKPVEAKPDKPDETKTDKPPEVAAKNKGRTEGSKNLPAEDIIKALSKLKKRGGTLSRQELADEMGKKYQTIGNWEKKHPALVVDTTAKQQPLDVGYSESKSRVRELEIERKNNATKIRDLETEIARLTRMFMNAQKQIDKLVNG